MEWKDVFVDDETFLKLKNHNHPIEEPGLKPNQGVKVISSLGYMFSVYEKGVGIRQIRDGNAQFPKSPNPELALLNDFLKNPDIHTIIIDGLAGTAKTATVMAHAVEGLEALGDNRIPMLYISKPHVPLGKSYGHLPGELNKKLHHEFTSYYQYVDRFINSQMTVERLMAEDPMHPEDLKRLETLPFEYLRGRNIHEGWVILDESQNTSIKEMDSFLTRSEDYAKLILVGDTSPHQLDRSGVTPETNGLAHAKRVYEGKPYMGYVELKSINHILRGNRVRDLFRYYSSINK